MVSCRSESCPGGDREGLRARARAKPPLASRRFAKRLERLCISSFWVLSAGSAPCSHGLCSRRKSKPSRSSRLLQAFAASCPRGSFAALDRRRPIKNASEERAKKNFWNEGRVRRCLAPVAAAHRDFRGTSVRGIGAFIAEARLGSKEGKGAPSRDLSTAARDQMVG